jgi:hypothetical protein
MREIDKRTQLRRRVFLRGAAGAPPVVAALAAGASITPNAAWANDVKHLRPATVVTMVRAARDIYPHDHLADRFYIAAVLPWDAKAGADATVKALCEEGAAGLDAEAKKRFGREYVRVTEEDQRVAVLKAIEKTPFFGRLRGDLVVSLYNQPEVWAKFGYEGPSWEKGGYLTRGFDDIDWLPKA